MLMNKASDRLSVTHEPFGGGTRYISLLRFVRAAYPLATAAYLTFHEFLAENVYNSIKELPELAAYHAIKAKDAGVDAEIERINLDIRQIDLDIAKAQLDLDGVAMVKEIGKLDEKKKALEESIKDCERGLKIHAAEVAKAREAAMKAMAEFKANIGGALLGFARAREEAAFAAIQASEPFLKLLDDIAVANHVRANVSAYVRNVDRTIENELALRAILEGEELPAVKPLPVPATATPGSLTGTGGNVVTGASQGPKAPVPLTGPSVSSQK